VNYEEKEIDMTGKPKISIITSVYNGEKFLESCIQSVINQTYENIEYIIIDGGSTDGTVDIIKKHEHRLHYWVSEKDSGIYQAWNKGLAAATGEWIAFLGSDDIIWNSQVLENAVDDIALSLKNNIRYIYGKINLLSDSARIISIWGEPWENSKKNILQYMTVTHCCAFHHRSLFDEYGTFNENFRIIGDYEFLLRSFVKGEDAFFSDRIVAGMHLGGVSANLRSKLTLAKEHILARQLNHLPPNLHDRVQIGKAHIANILAFLLGQKMVRRLSDAYRTLKGKDKIWSKNDGE